MAKQNGKLTTRRAVECVLAGKRKPMTVGQIADARSR
jgi:hypothetical protein